MFLRISRTYRARSDKSGLLRLAAFHNLQFQTTVTNAVIGNMGKSKEKSSRNAQTKPSKTEGIMSNFGWVALGAVLFFLYQQDCNEL